MPKPFHAQDDVEGEAHRLLLTLWLTTALSVSGLAAVAALVWSTVSPLVLDDSFLTRFTLDAGYFYAEQPAKSLAFEIGCLLSPFILALSHVVSCSLVRRLKESFLPMALRLAVGISWLLFVWCLSPLAYCAHPALEGMSPDWLLSKWFFVQHDFLTWTRFLYLGLGCWFVFFLASHKPSHTNRRFALLALLGICVLLVPSDAYTRSQINDEWRFTYHFNVVTHALAQVIDGHHLLINFPHIYGGYIEFLGPILGLFPRRIETLLVPFPLLHAVAVIALLLTARVVIRNAPILFVTGLGLLALEFILPSSEHCYSYNPVRVLFPALGLFTAAVFFRRPTRFKYGVASCLAAVAPLWNLDTGLVLWLSWSATLAAIGLGGRKPLQALKDLAIQTGLLIAGAIAFLLYLRIVSGLWPDPRLLVTFQKLVTESGYMCLGLLVPDVWMIVLTIYVIALATAFHFCAKKASSWKTHFILMLALMGIGLLSYFMGRSVESNMASASYPALLLAGILLDETRRLVRFDKLPRITWAFVLPVGMMAGWWALVFSLALPDLLANSGTVLKTWRDNTDTPFLTNAVFVQKWTVPGEKVFMLSNESGFYYYLTDTVSPIDIPGPGELLRSRDMDVLADDLASARFPKLFVEQNFYTVGTYKAEVFHRIQDIVSQHYRAVATSASGQVTLYVPR